MSRRKNFRQSHWVMELSPRTNVELRIVGIRSTFRGSTFFRLVEIRPYPLTHSLKATIHMHILTILPTGFQASFCGIDFF